MLKIFSHKNIILLLRVYNFVSLTTWKEIWLVNVSRFVRRSTILESKPELLEEDVEKSHHNGKLYYVNHYSLSVVKMETLRQIFYIYDG